MRKKGTIYLIHIHGRVCDRMASRHYIGFVKKGRSVEERFADHVAGRGAKFLAAAARLGIVFEVVETWPGTRDEERALKKLKNAPRRCPLCAGAKVVKCEKVKPRLRKVS